MPIVRRSAAASRASGCSMRAFPSTGFPGARAWWSTRRPSRARKWTQSTSIGAVPLAGAKSRISATSGGSLHGLKQDDGNRFATRVVVGARSWLILPHREIELSAGDCGVFISLGPDEFEWIKTRSRADGEQLIAITEALAAGMRREVVPTDRQAPYALIEKYTVHGSQRDA